MDVLAAVPLQSAINAATAPRDRDRLRIKSCRGEIRRWFGWEGFLQFSEFMAGVYLSRFDRAGGIQILMTWIEITLKSVA